MEDSKKIELADRMIKAFAPDPAYYWKILELTIVQGEKEVAAIKEKRKADAAAKHAEMSERT